MASRLRAAASDFPRLLLTLNGSPCNIRHREPTLEVISLHTSIFRRISETTSLPSGRDNLPFVIP